MSESGQDGVGPDGPVDSRAGDFEREGCRLSYRVRGQGPPIVWVQGVGVCGSGWQPQVDVLASEYSCAVFDNRGIGASQPRASGPLSIEQLAGDVVGLLDALGWPKAHLAGHSMGGLIALQVALAARERVRSLALLCTFADGRVATGLDWWKFWVGLRTRVGTRRSRRHAFLRMVLPPDRYRGADRDRLAAELAPLFGHDLADQPPVVLAQMSAMSRCNLLARLGELAGLPTLVLAGRFDRIAPPAANRAIALGIPGADYHELPNAAHGLPIEEADAANVLLRAHFRRADGN